MLPTTMETHPNVLPLLVRSLALAIKPHTIAINGQGNKMGQSQSKACRTTDGRTWNRSHITPATATAGNANANIKAVSDHTILAHHRLKPDVVGCSVSVLIVSPTTHADFGCSRNGSCHDAWHSIAYLSDGWQLACRKVATAGPWQAAEYRSPASLAWIVYGSAVLSFPRRRSYRILATAQPWLLSGLSALLALSATFSCPHQCPAV